MSARLMRVGAPIQFHPFADISPLLEGEAFAATAAKQPPERQREAVAAETATNILSKQMTLQVDETLHEINEDRHVQRTLVELEPHKAAIAHGSDHVRREFLSLSKKIKTSHE